MRTTGGGARAPAMAVAGTLAFIAGTPGPDTLEGGSGDDTLDGAGGDDVLYGLGGDDRLQGGLGYDWVMDGGSGNDTLVGGSGFDTAQFDFFGLAQGVNFSAASVRGDGSRAVVDAGVFGIDLLLGVEDVAAFGSAWSDTLAAGGGHDYLYGDAGADTLQGRGGDDTLDGGPGADVLAGGGGYDAAVFDFYGQNSGVQFSAALLSGSGAAITLGGDSLSGIECVLVYGSANRADRLGGGGGDDTLYGYGAADTLQGGGGYDSLWGGSGADSLAGGAADDWLEGDTGNDRIDGGAGYDVAVFDFSWLEGPVAFSAAPVGTAGSVQLADGVGGTDTLLDVEAVSLIGSDFHDALTGGAGDDILDGGAGNDSLDGGAGWDLAVYDYYDARAGVDFDGRSLGAATTVVVDAGSKGFDRLTAIDALALYGSDYADTLRGGRGDDYLEGYSGNDRLEAGAGADIVYGNEGNDRLGGAGGDDWLQGDAGRDRLSGGAGNDVLYGGSGADSFVFASALDALSNRDTIEDFASGFDRIELDDAVFTGIGPRGVLAPAAFGTGSTATSAAHRILFDAASGSMYFDADGTGPTAAVAFATLSPGAGLLSTDLFVV